ncbi:peptide 9.8 kDa, putative [Ixodes scapularis]|uniref:Peptide 9.8 kDa, putative n=1 Tax=Ixodes scapularis TaxID=6945 RepID=B7P0K3_IXOSC|nr:peptide 9.8 kDa, putative [Ixodes scapularis]|eukprot:XP_002399194.1 peptide 9.8 kDa, putative [Ixodes scapularis]
MLIVGQISMSSAKMMESNIFGEVALLAATMPAQDCARLPPPKCSLVFPSILFLNTSQYVCFERLLLPSISVRTHPDGTLCTVSLMLISVRTHPDGTLCTSPSESTVRPVQRTNQPQTTTPHAAEKSP